MEILITGSREFDDYEFMEKTLEPFEWECTMVIHGAAPGADALASRWAYEHRKDVQPYGAKWRRYRSAAGGRRNSLMLDKHPNAVVIGFPLPGSKGTWDCIHKAQASQHRVIVARRRE